MNKKTIIFVFVFIIFSISVFAEHGTGSVDTVDGMHWISSDPLVSIKAYIDSKSLPCIADINGKCYITQKGKNQLDPDLNESYIKKDINIFGVVGTLVPGGTVTEADVCNGKTFMSGSWISRTGNRVNCYEATDPGVGNVYKGVSYSKQGAPVVGTLERACYSTGVVSSTYANMNNDRYCIDLSDSGGTIASSSDVRQNKRFVGSSGDWVSGTMTDCSNGGSGCYANGGKWYSSSCSAGGSASNCYIDSSKYVYSEQRYKGETTTVNLAAGETKTLTPSSDSAFTSVVVSCAICTDDCTSGAKQCSGSYAYQTCGNYDRDPCLEWSSANSCGTTSCSYPNTQGSCSNTCSGGNCQACTPSCNCVSGYKQCDGSITDSDGCECNTSQVCYNGNCCTPNCAGKTCGSDGCGGSCGTCPGSSTCSSGSCYCTGTTKDSYSVSVLVNQESTGYYTVGSTTQDPKCSSYSAKIKCGSNGMWVNDATYKVPGAVYKYCLNIRCKDSNNNEYSVGTWKKADERYSGANDWYCVVDAQWYPAKFGNCNVVLSAGKIQTISGVRNPVCSVTPTIS